MEYNFFVRPSILKDCYMPDPRIKKLAQTLVHYSVELKPGQCLWLRTSPVCEEAGLAVYEEAIKAGAHVTVTNELPGADEIFYKNASDAQIDDISPYTKLLYDTMDAMITLRSPINSRALSGVDPARMTRSRKASAPLMQTYMARAARKELRWCVTVLPTNSVAQDSDMSLREFTEFYFEACKLNADDPVALWRAEGEQQMKLVRWLAGRDQVVLKGSNIDLKMSIKGRTFVEADGKYNFPDGEIFTGPVEDSANGWVRFRYPAIYDGKEVSDIELWFENGKVVKEKASKNQELLTSLLDMDAGSRFLGELGIGTNYAIQTFTKNILFDEKIGGTIHLAVGAGYPETGSLNKSGLHWDMICDTGDAQVTVDGDLFYKNGRPAI
jgi:aminopeptidase